MEKYGIHVLVLMILFLGSGVAGRVGSNTTVWSRTNETDHRTLQAVRPVKFYAMGDTPYSSRERRNLPRQIARLREQSADFVIHLGDMQAGRTTCTRGNYAKMASVLSESPYPLFIVPGDNDYYDCWNWQIGWEYWQSYLMHFHGRFGLLPFRVKVQTSQPENFSFIHGRVLFLSIHTTHAKVHGNREWNRRLNNNWDWTRNQLRQHASKVRAVVIFSHAFTRKSNSRKYWRGLSDEAQRYGLPVLFLQGNSHRWKQSRPFRAKNILVTVVDRGGIADPVLVTVDVNTEQVFFFERRPLTTA